MHTCARCHALNTVKVNNKVNNALFTFTMPGPVASCVKVILNLQHCTVHTCVPVAILVQTEVYVLNSVGDIGHFSTDACSIARRYAQCRQDAADGR